MIKNTTFYEILLKLQCITSFQPNNCRPSSTLPNGRDIMTQATLCHDWGNHKGLTSDTEPGCDTMLVETIMTVAFALTADGILLTDLLINGFSTYSFL